MASAERLKREGTRDHRKKLDSFQTQRLVLGPWTVPKGEWSTIY